MIYDIIHVTRFDYAAPVGFARCNLRLEPIDWPGQRVEEHALHISPSGRCHPALAEAGLAHVTRIVVEEPVSHLVIESTSRMRVDRLVPVPGPDDPTLAQVAEWARDSLDAEIAAWCAPDLSPDAPALEAGIALACRIQHEFAFDATATLVDTPPREAFRARKGVCQDFAQIMITGLRAAGLPAAYASGYIRTLPPPGEERLVGADATHAWVLL